MGVSQNCCGTEEERKFRPEKYSYEDEVLYSDLQKINDANAMLKSTNEKLIKKDTFKPKIKNKPFTGLNNYRNSNFINVSLQIYSKMTFMKDFVQILDKSRSKMSPIFNKFSLIISSISEGNPVDEIHQEFIDLIANYFQSKNVFSPVDFHDFFLRKLSEYIYSLPLVFSDYKSDNLNENTIEKLKMDICDEFSLNEIKQKFFICYLTSSEKYCKNIKCFDESNTIHTSFLPYIELKFDISESIGDQSIQEKINEMFISREFDDTCDKCGKFQKKIKNQTNFSVNLPKYLILLLNETNNLPVTLDYNLNKKICFFAKNYELFAVIAKERTPREDGNLFNCSIMINYKWVNFNDDIVAIIDDDILLENSFALYYQLR